MDLDGRGAATLMLLNPTGGMLGGDVLDTRVDLGEGAHVVLTTPAATRVYRSRGAPAVHRFVARVGDGARLEYVPDHLIPSPGARLVQTTEIELGRGAALILADAWAIGRVARGERWSFDALDLGLTVRDGRGVLLRERAVLDGIPRDGLGFADGFAYVATFAAIAPERDGWRRLADAWLDSVTTLAPSARVGASPLGRGGAVARFLCASAPSLEAGIRALWTVARRDLFGLPPLALRKL